MEETYAGIESVELVGGDPALDFVNTGSRRERGPFRERLTDFGALRIWSERVGLLSMEESAELARAAKRRPDEAESILARARELREALYRLFTARSAGLPVAADDLERLSDELARSLTVRRIEESDGALEYVWPRPRPLEGILWPIVTSAADLLMEGDFERVKECGGDNCNWLFYDASKNRSRRWCEMKDCGNRAKARRYQARHRHD
jgi:predicted RNA-binding Zn ribbon-like protein